MRKRKTGAGWGLGGGLAVEVGLLCAGERGGDGGGIAAVYAESCAGAVRGGAARFICRMAVG
jgi:hypothetical protein